MIHYPQCCARWRSLNLAIFATMFLCAHLLAANSFGQGLFSAPLGVGETALAPPVLNPDIQPMLPPQDDQAPLPLDSGPVHEAFANPIELDAQSAIRVAQQPPEPINELPPEIQPEGKNVHWIPGYWMWHNVRNDFVWVSGVYRDYPPNRRWTPGYWDAQGGEYVWISGFWASDAQEHLTYLPQPPESLDLGPTSQAPGENYFWVPGCWNWRVTGYRWRPGYWNLGYDDWLWIPSRYCYTPRGSVFVSGYWDRYPLYRRGLLYAPVYWNTAYYRRPGYYYRPLSVINTGLLIANLFVHDRHHHYYYGPRGWKHKGYNPWYHARSGRSYGHRYDPLVAHSRWRYGHNARDWNHKVSKHFRDYPSDYRRHTAGRGKGPGSRNGDLRGGHGRPGHRPNDRLVRNVNHLQRDKDIPWKLRRLNDKERAVAKTRSQEFKKFSQGRTKFERSNRTASGPHRATEANRPNRPHRRIADQSRTADSSRKPRASFKMPVDRSAKSRTPTARRTGDARTRTGSNDLRRLSDGRNRTNSPPNKGRSTTNTGVRRAQHTSRDGARTNTKPKDARTRPSRSRETAARTPNTRNARTRQAPSASRNPTKFSRPKSTPSVQTGPRVRTGSSARTGPSAQTPRPNSRTRPSARPQPTPRARTNSGSGAKARSAPQVGPRPAPKVRTRPTPSPRTRSAPTVRPRPTPRTRSQPSARPQSRPSARPSARPSPRPSARPTTRPRSQTQKPARVARSRPTAPKPSTRSAPRSRPTQARSKPASPRRAASPSRPPGGNRGASASRSRSSGASSRGRGASSSRSAGPSGGSRSRGASRSGGGSNRGGSRGKK